MSQFVHGAEVELLRLVVCMHASLQSAAQGDPKHSSDGIATEAEAAAVNTLALQLERTRHMERQRLEVIAESLKQQAGNVKSAIYNLCDEREEDLDADIRELNQQNTALGRRMIQLYDLAAVMAHEIESEILSEAVVPHR